MDNRFQNNLGEETEHPSREMLLLCVDGELPAKEAVQMETHLEACWPCRVKTKKIQEAIADIIEFDEVITPGLVPPQNWINFDRQLRQLASEIGSPSLSSKLLGSLARFFSTLRFIAVPRQFPKGMLMPMARTAAAALILALIVALVIRFNHEPIVSASELLRNVSEAQAAKIRAIEQPVVHQRFQVRLKDQASSREQSVSWEIWNDTKNARVRQFVTDGNAIQPVDNSTATKDQPSETFVGGIVDELTQVLVFNHMDPRRPLSAASYQSWHNTLRHQQDRVSRSKLSSGIDAVTLLTIPAGPVNAGQIAEAVFVVRANDWQPAELLLTVAAEGGNRAYRLTETVSEVVNLAQVDPTIFASEEVALGPAPKASAQVSPASSPVAKLNPNTLPLGVKPLQPVATAELEVETLRLLNQVGADLGEQITVTRAEGGPVRVSGIVETDKRKSDIVSAFGPVANDPRVQVDVQTVAEALAGQKQKTSADSRPVTTQGVEIQSPRLAAEPELRAFFERRGGNIDEEVRRFAARMAGGSRQAMQHLGAMKRLINHFSPEELRRLTPEARAIWLGLIRGHARAYRQQSAALRRELKPVFFPGASEGGTAGEAITADAELARAVGRLFEMGAANDEVIRSAFTTSAGGVTVTAIQTPQFWQAMNTAEALAAAIQSAQ